MWSASGNDSKTASIWWMCLQQSTNAIKCTENCTLYKASTTDTKYLLSIKWILLHLEYHHNVASKKIVIFCTKQYSKHQNLAVTHLGVGNIWRGEIPACLNFWKYPMVVQCRKVAPVVQWLAHCTATSRSWTQSQARAKFTWKILSQRCVQPTQLWWVNWVFTWSKARQQRSDWPSPS